MTWGQWVDKRGDQSSPHALQGLDSHGAVEPHLPLDPPGMATVLDKEQGARFRSWQPMPYRSLYLNFIGWEMGAHCPPGGDSMRSRLQSRQHHALRCADFMMSQCRSRSPSLSCLLPTPNPSRSWPSGPQTPLPPPPPCRRFP